MTCEDKVEKQSGTSMLALATFLVSLMGIFTLFIPLSLPAILLGHLELYRMRSGQAPAGGIHMVRAGLFIGYFCLGLILLLTAIYGFSFFAVMMNLID